MRWSNDGPVLGPFGTAGREGVPRSATGAQHGDLAEA